MNCTSSERLRTYKHAIALPVRVAQAMKKWFSNHTVGELLSLIRGLSIFEGSSTVLLTV